MTKAKEIKKVVHRDSDEGKFVTKKYADAHPKTTEREVRSRPASKERQEIISAYPAENATL